MEKDNTRNREIIRYNVIGIAMNLFLSATKFIIGTLSHSYAVVLDGFNSLTDLISAIFIIIFARLAQRKEDEHHPFTRTHGAGKSIFHPFRRTDDVHPPEDGLQPSFLSPRFTPPRTSSAFISPPSAAPPARSDALLCYLENKYQVNRPNRHKDGHEETLNLLIRLCFRDD